MAAPLGNQTPEPLSSGITHKYGHPNLTGSSTSCRKLPNFRSLQHALACYFLPNAYNTSADDLQVPRRPTCAEHEGRGEVELTLARP
jgi:hypothetical protein